MTTTLVLGLGESGLAIAAWAARSGDEVRVWDSRAQPPGEARLAAAVPGVVRIASRPLEAADLDGVDRVFKSPGLAPGDRSIAALLAAARERGVPVGGELDAFAAALDALRAAIDYAPRVIAVTGTNGKTTTTALAALLVRSSGKRVAVAGNIGPTMLQTLNEAEAAGQAEAADGAEAADDQPALRDRLPEVWVLELSSFQLADAGAADLADAAALLNVTEDHLDWHGDMAAYADAKARVFGERAVVVVNRDDPAAMRLVPAPRTLPPTKKGRAARVVERRVVAFGNTAPQVPGDFGLVVSNDIAWLARAIVDESGDRDAPPLVQPLIPADALRIRGRHNALNALAALALASTVGCPLAPMLHALRDYRGEPHRVEWIAIVDDVDFIDDSKGTNVGATVAALEGLGADRAPAKLVCILGGDGKGQDFAPLGPALASHARSAVTIGRDAGAIESVAEAAGVAFERSASLEAAVRTAFAAAHAGDAVLLSPACASLDMFRNYAHRAEVFVESVRVLAAERGVAA